MKKKYKIFFLMGIEDKKVLVDKQGRVPILTVLKEERKLVDLNNILYKKKFSADKVSGFIKMFNSKKKNFTRNHFFDIDYYCSFVEMFGFLPRQQYLLMETVQQELFELSEKKEFQSIFIRNFHVAFQNHHQVSGLLPAYSYMDQFLSTNVEAASDLKFVSIPELIDSEKEEFRLLLKGLGFHDRKGKLTSEKVLDGII